MGGDVEETDVGVGGWVVRAAVRRPMAAREMWEPVITDDIVDSKWMDPNINQRCR